MAGGSAVPAVSLRPLGILVALTALLAVPVSAVAPGPAALALGGAPPTSLAAPSFGAVVQLPSSTGFGEPSIAVGPEGNVYVAAPGGTTTVWRSNDGGTSFGRVAGSLGASGDSDIAVDADGTVYASDLFNNVPVSVSNNHADSFQFKTNTANGGANDRQWVGAHGHGNVWSQWRDGSTLRVAISHDGGHNYTRVVAATGVVYQGNMLVTSDEDLYIPYTDNGAGNLHLAASHDAGQNWTTTDAAQVPGNPMIFPAVAVDAAGTVYIAWAELDAGGGLPNVAAIKLVVSHDGGASWGSPIKLSDDNNYNMFPWIVADAAGHVAVTWLEGQYPAGVPVVLDPNYAAGVSWYVKVAVSTNADSATPTFSSARATGVMHTGPICYNGTACSPAPNPLYGNRALLDFYEMTEMPDGNVIVTFAGDTGTLGLNGQTALFVVKQLGGPNLKA